MRKLIILLLITAFGITAYAQQEVKKEVKVKKTSTLRAQVMTGCVRAPDNGG